MSLTTFGKAVRTARLKTDTTLNAMASELGTTPAFLSAIETGRKKIPDHWISKIEGFFSLRGERVELQDLAVVSNGSVSLTGLSPAQQMMVAGLARTNLDAEQLKQFQGLLRKAMKE